MVDPMKINLEDIIKIVREKGVDIKDKVVDEASDLKKAWFRHMLVSVEKLDERCSLLEARIRELEKNACKCRDDEGDNIRPDVS